MPKMLSERDTFVLNNDTDNRQNTRFFLSKKPKIISVDKFTLFQSGFNVRLVDENKGLTLYHVRFEVKRKKLWLEATRSLSQAVQVEVWRRAGSGEATHGLARTVFFQYLLPRYGAIFSDYLHTDSGKRFWLDRIAEALQMGHQVFFGDFAANEAHEIKTFDEVNAVYEAECWGNGSVHAYRRMLIVDGAVKAPG